jgi:hypothetical protein
VSVVRWGAALAGSVTAILGSTVVFVPQDITYLGPAAQLARTTAPGPLIAHDRAGFAVLPAAD